MIMKLACVCGLLLAWAAVAAAGPLGHADTSPARDASLLRLIKVSESDPGTWVREDDKVEKYVAKGVNFIDITDMSVGAPCPWGDLQTCLPNARTPG
jgi:bacterial leucyl aminopeptidase